METWSLLRKLKRARARAREEEGGGGKASRELKHGRCQGENHPCIYNEEKICFAKNISCLPGACVRERTVQRCYYRRDRERERERERERAINSLFLNICVPLTQLFPSPIRPSTRVQGLACGTRPNQAYAVREHLRASVCAAVCIPHQALHKRVVTFRAVTFRASFAVDAQIKRTLCPEPRRCRPPDFH